MQLTDDDLKELGFKGPWFVMFRKKFLAAQQAELKQRKVSTCAASGASSAAAIVPSAPLLSNVIAQSHHNVMPP